MLLLLVDAALNILAMVAVAMGVGGTGSGDGGICSVLTGLGRRGVGISNIPAVSDRVGVGKHEC